MRTILTVLLLAGCPSRTPPNGEADPQQARPAPDDEPEPEPAEAPAPAVPVSTDGAERPANAECIEECMHASMMEARSAESIRADCEAACGTGEPAPLTSGAELALWGGKRVKAMGTLKRGDYPTGGDGSYLELPDGAKLWVAREGLPERWDRFEGQTLSVVGTLTQGPTANNERIRIPFLDQTEEPIRIGELPAQSGPGLLPGRPDAPL